MYWRKKELIYEILVPPFTKPFEKMSLQEAENYYNWFIDAIPARIEYLNCFSNKNLDYSTESLIELWAWFLKHAEVEKAPKARMKELKNDIKSLPKDMAKTIIAENSTQFTLQTEYILRDVAMYFGEVCIRNNPSIHWGFHTDTKKDSFANMPILMGFLDRDFSPPFQAEFEPISIVRGIAFNIMDGDASKCDLKQMYDKWKHMM